ncbi:MAG: nucleotidyltransferase family protein [Anaerolineae bacterium]|nr:nucleotidyltransferase family protein [Anaerolineae bacterium]
MTGSVADGSVNAIVLAAGLSVRMGRPKLLLPWGDDSTIIREVCRTAAACTVSEVIVVTGADREAIESQLTNLPVRTVFNPHFATNEMISSLQAGLLAAGGNIDACLVILGDLPGLSREIIEKVLAAYRADLGRIVVPVYKDLSGHPVLFDRAFWPELARLEIGSAPRMVIEANRDDVYRLAIGNSAILRDIDTPDDYALVQQCNNCD